MPLYQITVKAAVARAFASVYGVDQQAVGALRLTER